MTTRILLVDDEKQLRTVLGLVLKAAGYEVREAANGREAIELFAAQPAELVITDLVMPVEEGLELIAKLRRQHPECRIIAMSGGGRVSPKPYLKMAAIMGAAVVLTKPFSNQELLDAVGTALLEK